jgi:ubiquitin conjugation factor E4 B
VNCAEIESTGSHTQFYDKFHTRYHVAQIFRLIWPNPVHREALERVSRESDDFVRFVNYLMNDTTFLLDEVLGRLAKIHRIQTEQASQALWASLTDQEREDRQGELDQSESSVPSFIGYASEALRLFVVFTAETPSTFVRPEIVDRLAAMLDFNLDVLAGPKMQELKVADPKKYSFQPRELLGDLLQIFLNLSGEDEFALAVARDGRSYSKELFEKAARIAFRARIKTEEELLAFNKLIERVERFKAEEKEDEEYGDMPDEFLGGFLGGVCVIWVTIADEKELL